MGLSGDHVYLLDTTTCNVCGTPYATSHTGVTILAPLGERCFHFLQTKFFFVQPTCIFHSLFIMSTFDVWTKTSNYYQRYAGLPPGSVLYVGSALLSSGLESTAARWKSDRLISTTQSWRWWRGEGKSERWPASQRRRIDVHRNGGASVAATEASSQAQQTLPTGRRGSCREFQVTMLMYLRLTVA